jgi:hypothetical protein
MESVVERTKRIEGLLERNYNATGRGLHEKITSVEAYFDASTIGQARFIASVRNKLLHEDGYSFDGEEKAFLDACDQLIEKLNNPTPLPPKEPPLLPIPPKYPPPYNPIPFPPQVAWYRSTLFLVLTFFLFPPLWFVIILTDHSKGCFTKLFAGGWVLLVLSTIVWPIFLLPAYFNLPQNRHFAPTPTSHPTPTKIPQDAPVLEAPPVSTLQTNCSIEWVEYQSNDLAGKNRSMVWEEIVSFQVKGSGMTAKQFYDQVLEKNPTLIEDDFVFSSDKSYYLPVCK